MNQPSGSSGTDPLVHPPHASSRHVVHLIGVPLDLGASRRGVDMGPSALRIARLAAALEKLGCTVEDTGNLAVPQAELVRRPGTGTEMQAITDVCRNLAGRTAEVVRRGAFPVVMGGDHSLAAGSVAGAATALAERGKRPALLPEHLVYIGLRDLDAAERERIRALGIRAYTMRDIDERGLPTVMREAIEHAGTGTGGLYLSCDADWIDPSEAPGVGTPVPGGATYREAHLAMELLADSGRLVGMDLVEINPVLDRGNRTAELAVELIASALGKRTL